VAQARDLIKVSSHGSVKVNRDGHFRTVRVAFFSTMAGSPWGGSEELWSEAAAFLAQNGVPVDAAVAECNVARPKLERLRSLGVEIWERKARAGCLNRIVQRIRGRWRFPLERHFNDWLKRLSPEIVCFSNGNVEGALPWMEICHSRGIRYATIGQSNSEAFWPTDDVADRLRAAFRNAECCFFVSLTNLRLFEDQIGELLRNAEIVRNPFHVEYDACPGWPDGCDSGPLRLACVARLEPHAKGQDLLFRVLAQEKWRQRAVELTLYGEGKREASLKRLVASLDLSQTVRFAGQVESPQRIWEENHGLLLGSRFEGLPLALVEAMLCHRLAVVTDVGGNSEILEHGATGFLAGAPTVQHIDGALEQAWSRRREWREIGLAAGRRIRSLIPRNPAACFAQRLLDITGYGL
jgi:glycosyltransferase involved in cell wall biosynthesis